MDSLRVSELAKELNLTSKEVIEKFAEISIMVKSHSNTVTSEQIRKLKEHLGVAPKKSVPKKAFIVKKAKTLSEEPEVVKSIPKEPAKVERISRVERIPRAEKIEKVEKVEKQEAKKVDSPDNKEPVKSIVSEKPVIRVERTKIEYPKNQSRIEIVRRAPQKTAVETVKSKDAKPSNGDKKPFRKEGGDKKLIERRIIPQEIYEGKGQSKKKSDNRKRDKDFNSKKEDQEMISLEKAAAQKHKKRSHKEEEKEAVTSIVVNQPMTIQELADKIGITQANLSILKTGKGKAIRFSTLEKICEVLECKPGDILDYERNDK